MKTKLTLAALVFSSLSPMSHASETIVIVDAVVRQRLGSGITSGPFANWNFGDNVRFIGGVMRPNPGGSTVGERLAVLDFQTVYCSVGSAFVNLSSDGLGDNFTVWNDHVSNGSPPFDGLLATYILVDQTTGDTAGSVGFNVYDFNATLFGTNDLTQLGGFYPTVTTPLWGLTVGDPLINGSGLRCRIRSIEIIQRSQLGTTLCSSATPNSTGMAGEMTANGFSAVDANELRLRATHLPIGQFSVLIGSSQQQPAFPL